MPGETGDTPSGWTTDTLRAYFERILDEREARYQRMHDATLRTGSDHWQHHNEVHEAHGIAHEREHKQTQDAVSKAEQTAKSQVDALTVDVRRIIVSLEQFVSKTELTAEMKGMEARITLLEKGAAALTGTASGISTSWAVLIAVIFVVVAVAGLVISLR